MKCAKSGNDLLSSSGLEVGKIFCISYIVPAEVAGRIIKEVYIYMYFLLRYSEIYLTNLFQCCYEMLLE